MSSTEPAPDASLQDGVSWRELAVARSVDSARTRAEKRVQRFMSAALELINSGNGKDFTIQEVVERSGQSLRGFYQHFDGKHELLLALFEESVLSTAEFLGKKIAEETDPLERLHRFVVEYHRACRPVSKSSSRRKGAPPIMADFAQRLLTERPTEAARAFRPLVSMFSQLMDDAAAAGEIRSDLSSPHVAGVVLEVTMFNVFSSTIVGSTRSSARDAAEELWNLMFLGMGPRRNKTKTGQ